MRRENFEQGEEETLEQLNSCAWPLPKKKILVLSELTICVHNSQSVPEKERVALIPICNLCSVATVMHMNIKTHYN